VALAAYCFHCRTHGLGLLQSCGGGAKIALNLAGQLREQAPQADRRESQDFAVQRVALAADYRLFRARMRALASAGVRQTHAVVMPRAFKKKIVENTLAYRRSVEKICCRVDFHRVRST
jgi:hypothetical protein